MIPSELGYLVNVLHEARRQFATAEPGSWAERIAKSVERKVSRDMTALGVHPQPQRLQ